MATGVRMALVMNLLAILFSVTLVSSDRSLLGLRSFKISENVTYDCIDIYKQPGLDHPLLKNHTIQIKPSVSRPELRSDTENNETFKKKIRCPYGTVPILRNFNEYNTKAQLFDEKSFDPLSDDNSGTHFAGVRSSNGDPYRGVEGWFSGYKLNIEKDQAVYTRIYLGSKLNNEVNYIQAGFMINPNFNSGDGRVWSYGYWKGKDGKGCYNMACPGFVQVSSKVPIAEPFDLQPGAQDKQTGNWWITLLSQPSIDIGYWPKELFNILGNGANTVGAGGLVQVSGSGSNPPMGNGKLPVGDRSESAIYTNVEVLDSNYKQHKLDAFPIEKLLDDPKCYGLRIGKVAWYRKSYLGFFFNYGGPGGNSCGV